MINNLNIKRVTKTFAVLLSIGSQAIVLTSAYGARLETHTSDRLLSPASSNHSGTQECRTQEEALSEALEALAISAPPPSPSSICEDSGILPEQYAGPLARETFSSNVTTSNRWYFTEIARPSPAGAPDDELPLAKGAARDPRHPLTPRRPGAQSGAAAPQTVTAEEARSAVRAMSAEQLIAAINHYGADFPFLFLSENQWDSLPIPLQDHWGATVKHCCKPVSTGVYHPSYLQHKIIRFDLERDPLISGKLFNETGIPGVSKDLVSITQNTPIRDGFEYQYTPPRELGSPQQLSGFRLRIPRKQAGEDELTYLARRFKISQIAPTEFTLMTHFRAKTERGSTSRVFFPVDSAPNGWPTVVLKLRFPFPWLEVEYEPSELMSPSRFNEDQQEGYQEASDTARADLAMTYPVTQCAENFKVSTRIDHWHTSPSEVIEGTTAQSSGDNSAATWTHFIKVHEYLNRPLFWRQGIFLQERARAGITAFSLAQHVIKYQLAEERGQRAKMQALLEFIRQYDIRDMDEAKTLLAVIEKFYEVVHLDLLNFRRENGLRDAQNYVESNSVFEDHLINVGLDYNRGANVLWSKIDHRWHIIDF